MKVEDWVQRIEGKISIINNELGVVCERLAVIETNEKWIKWGVLTILGGVVTLIFKVFAG